MDFFKEMKEMPEASEMNETAGKIINKESLDKFEMLMEDDRIGEVVYQERTDNGPELHLHELEEKYNRLFNEGDFFDKNIMDEETDIYEKEREEYPEHECDGDIYEKDDNGEVYKIDGDLLPNKEYTINGNIYKTDEYGNKISCDAKPVYTENGSRNIKEQIESGGEERRDDDDGGHIIARILGGSEGDENLVPMRRTLNRGDYKRMENEISKASQEEKDVTIHIDIEYENGSHRPSEMRAEYVIDGKKTVCEFDNNENSTELLGSLEDKINETDYNRLEKLVEEMKEDGCEVTITSVKTEYDEEGNQGKVTVGILDESTGTKQYREYEPG